MTVAIWDFPSQLPTKSAGEDGFTEEPDKSPNNYSHSVNNHGKNSHKIRRKSFITATLLSNGNSNPQVINRGLPAVKNLVQCSYHNWNSYTCQRCAKTLRMIWVDQSMHIFKRFRFVLWLLFEPFCFLTAPLLVFPNSLKGIRFPSRWRRLGNNSKIFFCMLFTSDVSPCNGMHWINLRDEPTPISLTPKKRGNIE